MGKVLVLFDSLSGNTQKMADFVAEGAKLIPGIEVKTLMIDQAKPADVEWCDGIAVGSPTNMGLLSWKMKKFWDETMVGDWMKIDGKIGCAFSSVGGIAGGAEMTCQSILTLLMNFGFLTFGVPDYVSKFMTLHYGAVSVREPRDEETREACRKLGKRLAEWVSVMVDGNKSQHPLNKTDQRLLPG